jgi:hypothetical protein
MIIVCIYSGQFYFKFKDKVNGLSENYLSYISAIEQEEKKDVAPYLKRNESTKYDLENIYWENNQRILPIYRITTYRYDDGQTGGGNDRYDIHVDDKGKFLSLDTYGMTGKKIDKNAVVKVITPKEDLKREQEFLARFPPKPKRENIPENEKTWNDIDQNDPVAVKDFMEKKNKYWTDLKNKTSVDKTD